MRAFLHALDLQLTALDYRNHAEDNWVYRVHRNRWEAHLIDWQNPEFRLGAGDTPQPGPPIVLDAAHVFVPEIMRRWILPLTPARLADVVQASEQTPIAQDFERCIYTVPPVTSDELLNNRPAFVTIVRFGYAQQSEVQALHKVNQLISWGYLRTHGLSYFLTEDMGFPLVGTMLQPGTEELNMLKAQALERYPIAHPYVWPARGLDW